MISPSSPSAQLYPEHRFDPEQRLQCCGNLRGATPKHKPDCRKAGENCPGCVDPAKPHIASCRLAATCCIGIDQPGVGFVHAADCPVAPNKVMRFGVDGERVGLPESLRRLVDGEQPAELVMDRLAAGRYDGDAIMAELDRTIDVMRAQVNRREAIVCELLFAARDNAMRNIILAPALTHSVNRAGEIEQERRGAAHCDECLMQERGGNVPHSDNCSTGRVLGLIAELMDVAAESSVVESSEKEIAPEEEGDPGDGIREGEPEELVCLKCGVRGGVWTGVSHPGPLDMNLLGINQLLTVGLNQGRLLITHRCEDRSADVARALVKVMTTAGRVEGGAQ